MSPLVVVIFDLDETLLQAFTLTSMDRRAASLRMAEAAAAGGAASLADPAAVAAAAEAEVGPHRHRSPSHRTALTPETRVHMDAIQLKQRGFKIGPDRYCSSRHRMPFNS